MSVAIHVAIFHSGFLHCNACPAVAFPKGFPDIPGLTWINSEKQAR